MDNAVINILVSTSQTNDAAVNVKGFASPAEIIDGLICGASAAIRVACEVALRESDGTQTYEEIEDVVLDRLSEFLASTSSISNHKRPDDNAP